MAHHHYLSALQHLDSKMSNNIPHLPVISTCHKDATKKHETSENLFVWPNDNLSALHNKLKKQEKEKTHNRGLNICNKTSSVPKEIVQSGFGREKILENVSKASGLKEKHQRSELQCPEQTLLISGRYRTKQEFLKEFRNQQRKMLQEQMAIDAKQDAIKQMQTTLSREKTKIRNAERRLEKETSEIQNFIKQVERKVVEAMKVADHETKARLQVEADIRKAYSEIASIKSDIAKDEETLKEYKDYAHFLYMLSPPEWREAQERRREERKAAKNIGKQTPHFQVTSEEEERKQMKSCKSEARMQPRPFSHRKSSISGSRSPTRPTEVLVQFTEDADSDEELELYFTDPQQLIQIIKELEENIIHLLENLQEEEENLKEITRSGNITKEKMKSELESVIKKKETLVNKLAEEKEILSELELKIKMFSFEGLSTIDMDKLLSKLTKLIAEVYTSCVGEMQATIGPLQMLASIENNMIELEKKLEEGPREYIQAVTKDKNMRRRLEEN